VNSPGTDIFLHTTNREDYLRLNYPRASSEKNFELGAIESPRNPVAVLARRLKQTIMRSEVTPQMPKAEPNKASVKEGDEWNVPPSPGR
jgi:hypothetical protein